MSATTIPIAGDHPYEVVVGEGLLGEVAAMLGGGVQRVAVVHPRALRATGEAVRDDLSGQGLEAHAVEVPDAEEAKTPEVAAFCWSVLGRIGLTRSDAVVGVGGGATTDLAGFVAATWARGVRLVLVPTTLLGMVDAAVGGKTAVNTAEGKNLVGVFHPPSGVVCDLTALRSLPRNEYVAGLAEVVKAGFVGDRRILEIIEANPAEATRADGEVTRELVERAIRFKADVVGEDLREAGRREVLNYGHTLGHAIELAEHYRWRHGAAVSVGMVFAAQLGRLAGRLDDEAADRHAQVLSSLGLPTTYHGAWPRLLDAMRRDKKARGALLRFVVLEGIGRPTVLEGPDPMLLAAAYAEIGGDRHRRGG
ncbi:MAG TPA: 3-dehydroquinate synthase [Jiangellales bacterium]|nr:3-dehydroquinate synthase [Jiangellales bacterium]